MPFIPGLGGTTGKIGLQAISDAAAGVGQLAPDGQQAIYEPEDGIYTDYAVRNHYEWDPQTYMLPILSPEGWLGQKAAFVCLSEPSLATWICDWTAERRGLPPDVPAAETGDLNVVLLYTYVDPDMLELMGDGETLIYRLSGTYVYGFKDSAKAKMYHGKPPWMSDQARPAMRVKGKLEKGISSLGG